MFIRAWFFAAMLSAAGIPLYIHLPQFVTVDLGLSLATLGAVLLAIRVLDFAQDPFLGWLTDRPYLHPGTWSLIGGAGLAVGFLALFAVPPPAWKVAWLTAVLALIFTCFSLLTILFYAQGTRWMQNEDEAGHVKLAGLREAGTAAGIVLATIIPTVLGYAPFALIYAGLVVAALVIMAPGWTSSFGSARANSFSIRSVLETASLRRLLLIAMVNALPVAITSTLFLFFVDNRLDLEGWAGPFLLIFFASAGVTAPLWSRAARKWGGLQMLLAGMTLAILAFVGAAWLPPGAAMGFGVICLASGAAVGADMVLLPALFARSVSHSGTPEGAAFGMWSLAAKLSLAVAAAVVLPLLQSAGFDPAGQNSVEALRALNLTYAILPCGLKLLALLLVVHELRRERT